jgi:hypothetical protein
MSCPHCGTENPPGSRFCKNCGSTLPTSPEIAVQTPSTHTPITQDEKLSDPAGSWWGNLAPDFRAALIVTLAILIIGLLSDLIPGLGFLVSIPFSILTYYIQGVLTGRFAKKDPRYAQRKFFLLGIRSGFWTGVVFSTVFTLIALAIQFTFTLGTAITFIPIILSQSLVDILLNLSFSGLGAFLYHKMGGKRMILASVGVVGCGTIIVIALVLGLVILFAFLGFHFFKDLLNPQNGQQIYNILTQFASLIRL